MANGDLLKIQGNQMPPGEGEYQVTSNNLDRGTFPAGQTVDLGAFWQGAHYKEATSFFIKKEQKAK